MTITFAELTEFHSGTDASNYTTDSYTPTPNRGLLALVNVSGTVAATPSGSGNGVTWTRVFREQWHADADLLCVFVALSGTSPSAGGFSFNCSGDQATGCTIHVVEIDGCDLTDFIGQIVSGNGGLGDTPATTFSPAIAASSGVYHAFGQVSSPPPNIAAPSGYTRIVNSGHTQPGISTGVAVHSAPGAVTTVAWGTAGAAAWKAVGIEILTLAGGGPHIITVPQIIETEVVQALSGQRSDTSPQVEEDEAVSDINSYRLSGWSTAATVSGQAATIVYPIAQIVETETLLTPLLITKTGTVPVATTTDAAQGVGRKKEKGATLATETDSVQGLQPQHGLATNTEIDIALAIAPFVFEPPPPPATVPWRVDLYGLNSDSVLLAGLPVQSWMFNYVLNAPGAFEADILLTHPVATEANIAAAAREIRVYRGDILVWGGYLWAVQADVNAYKLRVRGEGYFSRLRRRIIDEDLIKYDKDQADIAWDLIQFTQQKHGTFGFTNGSIQTGVTIDHVYCATDLGFVGEAVEELADMDDSFDFWVTPTATDSTNKVFKNASPRRGTTKAFTINQDNAISATYEIDGSDIANRVWGIGSGDCNPPEFEAIAGASISNFGELHDVQQFDDLDHLPSVKAHTREAIRLRKSPRRQVTIQIEERDYEWGTFDIGDIITVSSNRGYLIDSRQMRVIRLQVNFDPENRIAFYEVELDSVIGA